MYIYTYIYMFMYQAENISNKLLYDTLKYDCKQFSDEMERMCQMRELVERDAFQVQQEINLGIYDTIPYTP
jgi:hypothetical protein